jgi:hypothetical protein
MCKIPLFMTVQEHFIAYCRCTEALQLQWSYIIYLFPKSAGTNFSVTYVAQQGMCKNIFKAQYYIVQFNM